MLLRCAPQLLDAFLGLPRPAVAAISMSTSQRWFASSGEHKDSADTAGTGASSNDGAGPATTSGKPRLKSLSEVLGQPLSAALSAATAKQDGPTEDDLDALFGGPPSSRATPPSGAPDAQSSVDAQSAASTSAEGAAVTVKVDPLEQIRHAEYGYAALGGVMPSSSDKVDTGLGSLLQAQPRVHPKRTFLPGQSYEPSDLNAYAEAPASAMAGRRRLARPMPSADDVRQWADYKNVEFLQQFVSPAGRLLSRRKTRLPVKDHVHVMKQIKIARVMGLMAHEARLEKQHLKLIREKELKEAQERGLL